ncbi:MAG: GAF domain-containing protein [Anaerolineae bacterium]|nr:GAF domain-containing protein [Anaerolineae bacterium]
MTAMPPLHSSEQNRLVIFVTDAEGRLLYTNPQAGQLDETSGYAPQETPGQVVRVLHPQKASPAEHHERWEAVRAGREWAGEISGQGQEGEPCWEYVKLSPVLDAHGKLEHIVVVQENITGHRLAQAALQKRTEAVERLYEAGRRLGRTLDLGMIYQTIREVIAGAMPCDNLLVSSYDSATRLIRCEAAWVGDRQLDASTFPPIPLNPEGKGTQSLAIQTGEAVYLPDFEQQRRTSARQYYVAGNGTVSESYEEHEEELPRSALIVPCKLEDQPIGVLQVFSYRPDDYSQDDLRLLEALGPLVAAALANARLYEQAQREIAERQRAEEAEREQRTLAEALGDIAALLNQSLDLEDVLNRILTHVGRVAPFDVAHIGLVEEGLLCMVRCQGYDAYGGDDAIMALRLPIAEIANLRAMAANGQPSLIPDVHADADWVKVAEPDVLRAYLSVPIMSGDAMLGVISLMSETPGAFSKTQARRLQALADHAAIAIRNAQLYDSVQRHAAELEARVSERTEALRISEERARAQFKAAPLPTFVVQQQANGTLAMVDYNDAAAVVGKGDVVGWVAEVAASHPELYGEIVGLVRECLQQCATLEHEMYFAPGEAGQRFYGRLSLTCLPPDLVLVHAVDLTDRKRHEEVLAAALERERYLSDLRARLVTTVSHHFRTPLSIILSSAEILNRHSDKLTEADRDRRFSHIREAVERMVRLLDDVLEFGSGRADEIAVRPEPLDPVLLCEQIIARMGASKRSDVRVRLEAPESFELLLDRRLFSRVVHHLVSNAIKFSLPDREVVVRLYPQGERLVIQVQDEGIGIPLADRAHVFDGFHRGSNVGGIPGSGLGLAITRHNVELSEGTIGFESEEGQGTTFTVTWPLVKAAPSGTGGAAASPQ